MANHGNRGTGTTNTNTASPLAFAELDLEGGHFGLAARLAARRGAARGRVFRFAASLPRHRHALVARFLFRVFFFCLF